MLHRAGAMRSFLGLALIIGAVMLSACGGGGGGGGMSPDMTEPDGGSADAMNTDPLAAFSEPTRAHFHLVSDGVIADGRARVLYAPKLIGLDRFGANPRMTVAVLADGSRVFTGLLGFGDTVNLPGLDAEARAANIALVTADLGLPHRICGAAEILSSLSLQDECDKPARLSSFGTLAFHAAAASESAAEVSARIAAHLADGSAWDDLLVGYIAWEATGGQTLNTKLEISCVGGIGSAGDAILFDSPGCRARYHVP
jgi:hypothetical protein